MPSFNLNSEKTSCSSKLIGLPIFNAKYLKYSCLNSEMKEIIYPHDRIGLTVASYK